MAGKSLEYWQKRWHFIQRPSHYPIKDEKTFKLLELLREYSGFSFHYHASNKIAQLTNNEFGWFFKGRWNSHYATFIKEAIEDYYNPREKKYFDDSFHQVSVVLALIKNEIKNLNIRQDGDLCRILEVSTQMTGILFAEIDVQSVLETVGFKFEAKYLVLDEIGKVGLRLRAEINSIWPYPNNALKQLKLELLEEMTGRIMNNESLIDVMNDIKTRPNYDYLLSGQISTRMRDLFAKIDTIINDDPSTFGVTPKSYGNN